MKSKPTVIAVSAVCVSIAVCAVVASKVPLLTAAVTYHLRNGSLLKIGEYQLRLPRQFFPIRQDDRSVILLSGKSKENGRIVVILSNPQTFDYDSYRNSLVLTERASSATDEREVASAIGPFRCFGFQNEATRVGYWCVTTDAAVSMRYQGDIGGLDRFWDMVTKVARISR